MKELGKGFTIGIGAALGAVLVVAVVLVVMAQSCSRSLEGLASKVDTAPEPAPSLASITGSLKDHGFTWAGFTDASSECDGLGCREQAFVEGFKRLGEPTRVAVIVMDNDAKARVVEAEFPGQCVRYRLALVVWKDGQAPHERASALKAIEAAYSSLGSGSTGTKPAR